MAGTDEVRIDLAPLQRAFRELGDVFGAATRQLAAACRDVEWMPDGSWMPDASPGLCWSDLMDQINKEIEHG